MKYILSLSEKILMARYMYKLGVNYITDQEYDALIKKLPPLHPLRYLQWEDIDFDEIEEIASKAGISLPTQAAQETPRRTQESDISVQALMSRFPSASSMQMVTDYDDVFNKYVPQIDEIYKNFNIGSSIDLFQSFKMDGWNITCYYEVGKGGKIFVAHTRGRTTSDVTVCTEIMNLITPNIDSVLRDTFEDGDIVRITGELVLQKSALQSLRDMYPAKSFSNVRNSVSAFVHSSIDIDKCYNMVSFYAYSLHSIMKAGCPFSKASEVYDWLGRAGFLVPPHYLIQVPAKISDNNVQNINNYLDAYYKSMEDYYKTTFSEYFECDGIVLQPDILSWNEHIQQVVQGSFGDGLIAIKARYWAEKIYVAEVAQIVYPKARASRSVMALVKPVTTALGQIVRRVPLINLQRAVIENDVHVGDKIEFVYHSNQLPFFTRNLSAIERKRGAEIDQPLR